METNYLSILRRVDGSARILGVFSNIDEAFEAAENNWQNRRHPENVADYVVVATDGSIVETRFPPTPRRPSLGF